MLEDALRFPRNRENALETIVVGGILTVLGVLIVPAVLVLGYLVEVVRCVQRDEDSPPGFGDWGRLLRDGARAFVVVIGYALVPAVLLAVTVGFALAIAVAGFVSPTSAGAAIVVLFGLVAALVALLAVVVTLVVWYVLPAALVRFARADEIGAAFDLGELRRTVLAERYAVGWLVALAIGFLASLVNGFLSATVVGGLVVPFVGFYAAVASVYAYARGVEEATSSADGDRPEAAG